MICRILIIYIMLCEHWEHVVRTPRIHCSSTSNRRGCATAPLRHRLALVPHRVCVRTTDSQAWSSNMIRVPEEHVPEEQIRTGVPCCAETQVFILQNYENIKYESI